jgi:hypothetical protein
VLASAFAEQQSLGLADGQGSVREEAGTRTTKKPKGGRRSQGSEGRVGEQAAEAIGRAPRHRRWLPVSDRERAVFEYLAVCPSLGQDFVIRAVHTRRVDESEDTAEAAAQERRYLRERARQLVPPTAQT